MSPEKLIREYLPKIKIMQLATASDNQPWVCTIHYYNDDDLNLYWISTTARQHSRDIEQNPKVATTILAHENTPEENYVVGISVAGTAELIGAVGETIGKAYIEKHGKDPNLLADIASSKNPHKFYRLKPLKFVLFDSKHFPDNPRQEWIIEKSL